MDLESYDPDREARLRDKAMLSMRRLGVSYDQIAEELGMQDRFAVIDALNDIYKRLEYRGSNPASFRPDVREIVDYVDNKIDDLVTAYYAGAKEGDIKAAKFVLDALKLKVTIHGGIAPSQINVQVNQEQKPWDRVYRATVRSESVPEIDGEVVD